MKKIILLAFATLMMAGRAYEEKNTDGTYSLTYAPRTYIIDSCEYIGYLSVGPRDVLAHKGNCRFCAERKKQEIDSLVEQIKEK